MRILGLFLVVVLVTHGASSKEVGNPDDVEPMIIGGDFIPIERAPYQVLIIMKGKLQCGGSLISPDLVLTAAHCLKFGKTVLLPSEIMVFAGSSDRFDMKQSSVAIWLKLHGDYEVRGDGDAYYNDIALVQLGKKFTINDQVRPVVLKNETTEEGTECFISGWGTERIDGSGEATVKLKGATVLTMPFEECNKTYSGTLAPLHPDVMCAGVRGGGVDSCQGDSGGPLVCNNTLVGVVSYGYNCTRPTHFGLYMEVFKYVEWIEEQHPNGTALDPEPNRAKIPIPSIILLSMLLLMILLSSFI